MWKIRLEDEGVKVHVGLPNMKVHAKMCVIKKREFNRTTQYGFISTGNFNEGTAQYYGDHCLLTTNRNIIADMNKVFRFLENPNHKFDILRSCNTLPTAPHRMRNIFIALINREIRAAKKGQEASVMLKMNSLVDKTLILKLYEAAKAGVDVQMIIRGSCCAYTQQSSFKGRMKVLSIIDEYLEHARVMVFHNGGKHKVYISSADWMVRNLDHRIETACPILDPDIQKELIAILQIQLSENVKGRILDNEQLNEYVKRSNRTPKIRSQLATYNYLQNKKDTY
jgi:polyphosphate kinase